MEQIQIVKIGGNVIDDVKGLRLFLRDFAQIKGKKILIHGGGKIATEISKSLGIKSKMVDGRRITDAATLKVVTMVYAGLINKNIVAQLQSYKCNAIGLTGADANTIPAKKRKVKEIDYGFVGDVEDSKLKVESLKTLLKANLTPIFCALTHDGKGSLLNTNADTIASSLATALSKKYKVNLIYCFEKGGVLRDVDDETSLIRKISSKEYSKLKYEGVILGGMIPKMDNAFSAIKNGVKYVYICHAGNLSKICKQQSFVGTCLSK